MRENEARAVSVGGKAELRNVQNPADTVVNFSCSRIAVAVQRGNLIAINRWLYRRRTAAQGSVGGGSG